MRPLTRVPSGQGPEVGGDRVRLLLACGIIGAMATAAAACGDGAAAPPRCESTSAVDAPDYLQRLGCAQDFDLLSSAPLDATIPGARSVKVVLDRFDGNALYFQNSGKYKLHHQFAAAHLSGQGRPLVPSLATFNRSEYSASDRRFVLAAVTYYEGPKVWTLEIAPYDTANQAMIQQLYEKVKAATHFGAALAFHPSSTSIELTAATLPPSVRVVSTDQLFAATDYQPLNLGTTVGRLRYVDAAQLEQAYVGFRDVVVLDRVPNDISVVAGLITRDFQTPLSHVNVLAQNRGTPNMGLRDALTNTQLRALDGQWVSLRVGASDWSIRAASDAEAEAFWEANAPAPVVLPTLDLSITDLRDVGQLVPEGDGAPPLRTAIRTAILAFGAKATNYGVLTKTPDVPIRKAFAIPVYYYVQFMQQNGFFARVDQLLADAQFVSDPRVREAKLAELRAAMSVAPVDTAFQAMLRTKLSAEYPGLTMRFRTSTNAEDLDGFPCAGCYDSHTGDPTDWDGDLLNAIRDTWAGVWFFRTFEERAFHRIDHKAVGMALLVHHNFPDEEANGVALTANPFDPSGVEPGFYVNVQWGGGAEVVHPPEGITSDELLLFYGNTGSPVSYLSHSNLVPEGQTVLSTAQLAQLGAALDAIHRRFSPAYGPAAGNTGFYAMDVEFKYDDEDAPGQPARLQVKQARPHPGRGQ